MHVCDPVPMVIYGAPLGDPRLRYKYIARDGKGDLLQRQKLQ